MAGATHLVNATNNSNPSASVSGTTGAAITAGDKVIVSLLVPNSNPTSLTVTVDGQACTEITGARSARSNFTILAFYFDDSAGRASGKTVSAAWTNTGTNAGGGSLLLALTATPTNAFTAGAPDKIGTSNGLSQAPSTGASGTPTDTTANYFACAVLGSEVTVAATTGTPANSYTAMTQAVLTARGIALDVAWKEFTSPPVATQTETWPSNTWGANKAWEGHILMFKESVPSAPTNSTPPVESGTETVGSTLSTTDGTWTNTPTSYSYQWQRDVGTSGSTWLDISGATANTYVITVDDLGSKLRCSVTATNANGNSSPEPSNTTSVTIPAPSGLTYRIVGGPVAQSDAQTHTTTITKPVLAGDRIVAFAACSNANTTDGNGNKSDIGSVADSASNTWTEDVEAFSDTNILHSAQAFSAAAAAGIAYGGSVTMTVHGGTGAGGYHGQSPYWILMAVTAGSGTTAALDHADHDVDILTSHAAPSITTTNNNAVVFGFHVQDGSTSGGWWTPTTGFTEICDTADAAVSGGESAYAISAEGTIATAGYTGGAGGSTGGNKAITNLVVAYSIASSSNVSITGVRGLATAAGKAGSPKVTPTGVRALATAAGKVGAPRVAVTGSRALATAGGKAGTVTVGGSVAVTGVRAAATAAGRAGSPKIALGGVRATATATGKAGSPWVAVTGSRAAATATGKAGSVATTGGGVTITGVRALATATGRAGSPKLALGGVRATATATGRTGSPWVAVTGSRAAAVAAGKAGSVTISGAITIIGVRALATATGNTGSPKLNLTGSRGLATATGRAGSAKISLTGPRSLATATGKTGTFRVDYRITGSSAAAAAAGNPGTVVLGEAANAQFTTRTQAVRSDSGLTLTAMDGSRTKAPVG